MNQRRVAFFSDSFHEVNGVALTSRRFEQFARERGLPMFSCHAGPEDRRWKEGSIERLEWKRSWLSLRLDADLGFDLLFGRKYRAIVDAVREFRPDVVHVTAPGDAGILGVLVARALGVPLAASWHTNVHEFGARRLGARLGWLPEEARRSVVERAERWSLAMTLRYYALARVLFAPNPELVEMLSRRVRRPVRLMSRGVDTALFRPALREGSDRTIRLGYVGRITAEKNVGLLVKLEAALREVGVPAFEVVVVGQGALRETLQGQMRNGRFTGVLKGEALAREYANFDVFVFPSETDTFGNVVMEALASGVPAIVMGKGGPQYLIEDGRTGYVAIDGDDFVERALDLARDAGLRRRMAAAAREYSVAHHSWSEVFEAVYEGYGLLREEGEERDYAMVSGVQ